MNGFNGYAFAYLPFLIIAGKIIFWFAVAVIVLFAIRQNARNGHGPNRSPRGDDEAIRILRKRYAAGEIDREEFEEKLKGLS